MSNENHNNNLEYNNIQIEKKILEKNENLNEKEKKLILKGQKEKKNKKKKSKTKKESSILDDKIIKETLIPPECNTIPYIPKKISQKKKTIVVDLDETLVHSYFDKKPPYEPDISYDIEINGIPIHISTLIRPGAYQFLEAISKLYEIVIFTASLSQYAIPLLNIFDKNNYCEHKLFREHCYIYDNKGNPGYVKDLTKLNRDLNNVIIIDNNPNCYYFNKDNGIPIKTWFNDKNDKELSKLKPYLEFLANDYIEDVKPILNKVKEGKRIKYDVFDEIIENYSKKIDDKIKEENANTINDNHNNSKTIESSKTKIREDKTSEKNIYNSTINKSEEKKSKNKEELLNLNIKNLKKEKNGEKDRNDINYLTLENYANKSIENKNQKDDCFLRTFESNNNKLNIYRNGGNKNNTIDKEENNTKNSILNSLEKSTRRIFLQLKNGKKINNNIKCINLFQKNHRTIENENTINRYKNYNINDINNKLKTFYKNRNFYEDNSKEKEQKHKLNIIIKNDRERVFSFDSKNKNIVPKKEVNKKKENNIFKLNINDYKLNINKFKLKLNLNKIKGNKENNISFNRIIKKAKLRLKNTPEINTNSNIINNNLKRKIRFDKNKHSHYNIGICLSEFNLDENNNSFKLNPNNKPIKLNINNYSTKEKFKKIREGFKNDIFNNKAKDLKDIYILKSKTMYNLSNKEKLNKKRLCLEEIDSNYLRKMKKNNSLYTSKKCEVNNYQKNKTISINQIINKTERNNKIIGKKISLFDNIIYSKKINQKRKENLSSAKNNTNPNKINLKTLDINIQKILKTKLPLSKRVDLYSRLQKELYNKNKIILL